MLTEVSTSFIQLFLRLLRIISGMALFLALMLISDVSEKLQVLFFSVENN